MSIDWEQWLAGELIDGDEITDMEQAVAHVQAMDDDWFQQVLEEHQQMANDEGRLTLAEALDCGLAGRHWIVREVGSRVAERLGLYCHASSMSEAVYLRADRDADSDLCRIAAHAANGVSRAANGIKSAPMDVRISDDGRDETSTHVHMVPRSMADLDAIVDAIVAEIDN